jgi:hypothetical protein
MHYLTIHQTPNHPPKPATSKGSTTQSSTSVNGVEFLPDSVMFSNANTGKVDATQARQDIVNVGKGQGLWKTTLGIAAGVGALAAGIKHFNPKVPTIIADVFLHEQTKKLPHIAHTLIAGAEVALFALIAGAGNDYMVPNTLAHRMDQVEDIQHGKPARTGWFEKEPESIQAISDRADKKELQGNNALRGAMNAALPAIAEGALFSYLLLGKSNPAKFKTVLLNGILPTIGATAIGAFSFSKVLPLLKDYKDKTFAPLLNEQTPKTMPYTNPLN